MTILLIVAILAFVVLVALGLVASTALRRRSSGVEVEPPPTEVAGPEVARPEVAEAPPAEAPPAEVEEVLGPPEVAAPPRLRDRLGKARNLLATRVSSVLARSGIDEETWEELEEALITADVGVSTTTSLLDGLRTRVKAGEITGPDVLLEALKSDLKAIVGRGDHTLRQEPGSTNVWLFVGVNGVGKTTTIGKVGMREAAEGRSVVMAAGDTFRAAATEQLALWADRVEADLVRGSEGGDPGSVLFDAVQRAVARGNDLVLVDTAGRLHTKVNLMEELKKVRRVAERSPAQLSEVLLVLDATTGQNGLVQARQFSDAVGVTGVVLTKLDGTAKGGIAVAVVADMGLPIKLVGLGESAADLVPLDADEFVEALFA
ncbi:MAG: signal recognition particle-docking protein FtsY [Actinobacteria bacterium]|nr:MAG: signal recognition particle-docking protein FtsY [Actinomycetota bacterium]